MTDDLVIRLRVTAGLIRYAGWLELADLMDGAADALEQPARATQSGMWQLTREQLASAWNDAAMLIDQQSQPAFPDERMRWALMKLEKMLEDCKP